MITRRTVLYAAAASAGALLVGCRFEREDESAARAVSSASADPARMPFGAYIEIHPDGRIILYCAQSEMGQGVMTALPKITAEELEVDWNAVEVRHAPGHEAYINPVTNRQRSANSESVLISFDLLRKAGAAAREMLIAAAAARWNVAPDECRASRSQVLHESSGRRATYASLATEAARLAPPADVALKPREAWTLLGRSSPRKDSPPKCDGSAVFGIDIRRPDMVYAALARSPAVVSRVVRFDREAALALPGVIDVFEISDGVAVVATSTWHARTAAEQLDVEFDGSAVADLDDESIREAMRDALEDDAAALPARVRRGGAPYDADGTSAALAAAPRRGEFVYEVPFLAHAALEPLVCTVLVGDDECEVWAPTQQPDRSREVVAEVTGLPLDAVRFNVVLLGGGFGRKWETDFVHQTAEIAVRMRGRPVKLTWTREQDFQHDRFRSAHWVRTRVGLSDEGRLLAMHSRISGISMWKFQGRADLKGYGDPFATGHLIADVYDIPVRYVDFVETPLPVPVGTWRSVSQSMNGFFSECAIDEAAVLAGADPWRFRRGLLEGTPRALAVLDLAAHKAGWGEPLPPGRGRGIALSSAFGSYCAQVVEVSVEERRVHIERIVCAFDCGTVIDPRGLDAQLVGGIVWGLSAARDGRMTFAGGQVEQANFDTAPVLRLAECPPIEIHVASSGDRPGGAGEASVPPVAPALVNAIHAATGVRLRRLPVTANGYEFV